MDIEVDAFNSAAFMNLQDIAFRMNNNFHYLRKDSFKGSYSLTSFALEMGIQKQVGFEKNFLQYMSTITSLQLHRCILTEEHLANLTSSDVYLMNLQIVDFQFNFIPTINAGAFANLRAVVMFYLASSAIEKIESGVFSGLNALKILDLSWNDLTTLSEGVFSTHVNRVDLHNNRWQCDCNLQWLKELYMNSDILKKSNEPLTCNNFNNKEFSEVVFCNEESTSSTSSVTTTETSTTTKVMETTEKDTESDVTEETGEVSITTTQEPSKRYKEIVCRDWLRSPLTISGFGDLVYNQTIQTVYESLFFEFYDPDIEPIELTVVITGNITGFHLLWFNSHNISETGCVTNMENTIVLNSLQRTKTYTFCILYNEQVTVSPYDCFGFEIRVPLPERAWIQNKHSTICMISGGVISVLIILLSIIITYFCILKHPVLIKGNKRVIIVGKKKPEESTTPKEYERPVYIPPSILSMLSAAAQSTHGYTRIRRRHYRSPRLRSLSEHSIFSNEVSYIRPAGPSNYQLNTWRLRSKIDPKFVDVVEGSVYPPPLPPPNNNIQRLSWEENLYTTL